MGLSSTRDCGNIHPCSLQFGYWRVILIRSDEQVVGMRRCSEIGIGLSFLMTLLPYVSAAPAWWDAADAVTGDSRLIIGRGAAAIEAGAEGETDAWRQARDSAIGEAALVLCPSVESVREDTESETGTGGASRMQAFYSKRSVVRASLRHIPAVEELDRARDGNVVYVRIGIPRTELAASCRLRIERAAAALQSEIEAAGRLRQGDPAAALRHYAAALGERETLDNALDVLSALKPRKAAMPVLPDAASRAALRSAIAVLTAALPEQTREQLVARLLDPLAPAGAATDAPAQRFFVAPLLYGDSDFVSPFGSNLADTLAAAITRRFGWNCLRDPLLATQLFAGRVTETGAGVQITLRRRFAGAADECVAVAFVPAVACADFGWGSVKPANWEQALRDEVALRRRMAEDPALRIELRTDAPPGVPVVLRYGERPRLWVRAGRPCKVRVLHVFSDGTNALLIDDYPIPMERVNQWIKLPVSMRITPPAGIEQLLVQAVADGELPRLAIRQVRMGPKSYRNIVRGRLDEALAQARGSCIEEKTLLGENILNLTILEK
jgi:hypothetical protein